jgi:hypothetical protein
MVNEGIVIEQNKRIQQGRKDTRMPLRPIMDIL